MIGQRENPTEVEPETRDDLPNCDIPTIRGAHRVVGALV